MDLELLLNFLALVPQKLCYLGTPFNCRNYSATGQFPLAWPKPVNGRSCPFKSLWFRGLVVLGNNQRPTLTIIVRVSITYENDL